MLSQANSSRQFVAAARNFKLPHYLVEVQTVGFAASVSFFSGLPEFKAFFFASNQTPQIAAVSNDD